MMPCLRVGDHFLAESTFFMEERFHWLFECLGIRSNRWGGIVNFSAIQEAISQGAYHTHTQMISKVYLGTEPIYQGSTNPGSL